MTAEFLRVMGGLGLFLLGMLVMTEGLRSLAGDASRRLLTRFTRNPLTGAMAGTVTTALIQSSSATTVTTIGFVGAGLLTFPQALGVIFGANVGTTATGWLVAVLGFKLRLGTVVLPLVLIGVLFRIFATGRLRQLGWALAGFSLLFVGIEALQQGVSGFQGVLTPASFPENNLWGRFQLLLMGVAITLVTQSSSAGVATALAALGGGAISFVQAAAMVIGMDVGTTFTAGLATIGGSTDTRRTGYAHVVYNLMTGGMAFLLLGPLTSMVKILLPSTEAGTAQLSLVFFHTLFNTAGVVLVLPFTSHFARLIIRLVPERGPLLTRRLDARLLVDAVAATAATAATVRAIAWETLRLLAHLVDLRPDRRSPPVRIELLGEAVEVTRQYAGRIPSGSEAIRRVAQIPNMHALDHLSRLLHRCTQLERIQTLHTEPRLVRLAGILLDMVSRARTEELAVSEKRFDRLRSLFRRQRRSYRGRMLGEAALGHIDTETALLRLDSVRWLHRVSYHLWRIIHHLEIQETGAVGLLEEKPGEGKGAWQDLESPE